MHHDPTPHSLHGVPPRWLHHCKPHDPARRYGLEFQQQLTWKKWQPGGEYPKTLVVRNVSTQASDRANAHARRLPLRTPHVRLLSQPHPRHTPAP
jgi:hypothetical protein